MDASSIQTAGNSQSAGNSPGNLHSAATKILSWLYQRTVLVVSLLFLIVVIMTITHVHYLQQDLVESGARQAAQLQAELLTALRSYYTSEVV